MTHWKLGLCENILLLPIDKNRQLAETGTKLDYPHLKTFIWQAFWI